MCRTPILAAALHALLLVYPARADLITPDLIYVPPDTLVTDQYRSLGLVFKAYAEPGEFGPVPFGTHVQGASWWGLTLFGTAMSQTVNFVVPGTADPATTDTLHVQVASAFQSRLTVDAFGIDGRLVRSFSMITDDGYVGQWVTLQGPGIHSFTASEDWWDPDPWLPYPDAPGGRIPKIHFNHPGWQIDAIEFQPVAAVSEPGTFVLFTLGSLALAAWARPRRRVTALLGGLLSLPSTCPG